jgi:hypothetical protein
MRVHLQLSLDLVEKPPVSVASNDPLRIGLDESRLVQSRREKSHGVLGIVIPPSAIGQLLQGIVVARRKSLIDHQPGRTRGFVGTQVSGLQKGPNNALGRYRVVLDELDPAEQYAAEVVRPRTIGGTVDQRMPDSAGAELLGLGRNSEKGIDLPVDE